MAKKTLEGIEKFNRVHPVTNAVFTAVFAILALICIVPVIFIVIISFSSDTSIQQIGYSFIPQEWSLEAYSYLWNNREMIGRALVVSVVVTVVGCILGLYLTATMGYCLSRPNFKLKGFLTWVVFIPMIFSGGLVATYNVYTSVLHINNTLWVLILPLAVSSFNVTICKTFFRTTVPDEIIESAKIDGAPQLRIFFQIVVPISLPVLATIGLFLTFAYWNDWWLSLMYIDDRNLFSLQAVLMSVERNIEFLASNATSIGVSAAKYAANMPRESMRMAMAVVIILPIACAYPFFQKYFVSGLTIGAVKG
ncbi:MAG TPA: carbohydrate ABC transporter permease [Candidatus Merdivicinus intestinavium]|nr:carbohydrate ABC transporter permease [Candidatus Merdivicinus intestinavium]